MGRYTYKPLCLRIPERIINQIEGFDGDSNYNGDYWTAADMYVTELEERIAQLEAQIASGAS